MLEVVQCDDVGEMVFFAEHTDRYVPYDIQRYVYALVLAFCAGFRIPFAETCARQKTERKIPVRIGVYGQAFPFHAQRCDRSVEKGNVPYGGYGYGKP